MFLGRVYNTLFFIPPKIVYMNDFYDRVKKLVRKKGKSLTLQEFIISLDIKHDTYYGMRRLGNLPRADEALTIAQALGTTVEYLVSGKNPVPTTADEALETIYNLIEMFRVNNNQDRNKLKKLKN